MQLKFFVFFLVFFISQIVFAFPLDSSSKIEIEANKIEYLEFANEKIIEASGNVKILQLNQILRADKIIFNKTRNTIIAKGNVHFLDQHKLNFYGEEVEINNDLKIGVANALKLIFPDKSILKTKKAHKISNEIIELNEANYSPCKVTCKENPLWSVSAEKVEINRYNEIISYKNAFLNVKNVPIFYTPFFSHPTPNAKRKSGFLAPTIINNSFLGKAIKLQYYFNLAPHKDLVLQPIITSRKQLVLNGNYRHLFENGAMKLIGSFAREEDFKKNKKSLRNHIITKVNFNLEDNWKTNLDLNLTSDKTYIKNYQFKKNKNIESDTLVSKIDLIKYHNNDFFKLESLYFQNLRPKGSLNNTPILLPYAVIHKESDKFNNGSYFTNDLNVMSLKRKTGVDINRFSIKTGWNYPYIFENGNLLNFGTSLRGDIYDYNYNENYSQDRYVSRIIPEIDIKWRYPLLKTLNNYKIVVEPISIFSATLNKNYNKKIYNEDSQNIELSDANLFSKSRYSGLDLIEIGPRYGYGVKSALYRNDGSNVNFMIGQIYKKNNLYSGNKSNSEFNKKFSNYVGRLGASYLDITKIFYRYMLDNSNFSLKRYEVALEQKIKNLTFKIEYISFNDNIEDYEGIKNKKELFLENKINNLNDWSFSTFMRKNLTKKNNNPKLQKLSSRFIKIGGEIFKNHDCIEYSLSFERDFTKMDGKKPSNTWWAKIKLKNLM